MKTLFSSKRGISLVNGGVSVFILFAFAAGFLISPAPGVFANINNKKGNKDGQVTLSLKVPNCTKPTSFSCLAGTLNVHYVLNSSLKDNKSRFGLIGVFEQKNCSGTSLLVDNVDQIKDGQDSGDFSHNVSGTLKTIPKNWRFCLFLSDRNTSYRAAQANFIVAQNGLTADTGRFTIVDPPNQ